MERLTSDAMLTFEKIFILNKEHLSVETTFSRLFSIPKVITQSRFVGSLDNSQANISAHYDIGNVLFVQSLLSFTPCD